MSTRSKRSAASATKRVTAREKSVPLRIAESDEDEISASKIEKLDDEEESESTQQLRAKLSNIRANNDDVLKIDANAKKFRKSSQRDDLELLQRLLETPAVPETEATGTFFDYFSEKCAPDQFYKNAQCIVPDQVALETIYDEEIDSSLENNNAQRLLHFKNFYILKTESFFPELLIQIESLRSKFYLLYEKEPNIDQKKLLALPIHAIDKILNPTAVIFTKLLRDAIEEKAKSVRVLQAINRKSLESLKLKTNNSEQSLQLILAISSILIHTVTDVDYIDLDKFGKYQHFAFANIKEYMGSTRIINSFDDLITKPECFLLNEKTCKDMSNMCTWKIDEGCRQKSSSLRNEFLKKEPTLQTFELKNQYEKSVQEVKKGLAGFAAGTAKLCLNALRSASSMITTIPYNKTVVCSLVGAGIAFYIAPLIEPVFPSVYSAGQILGGLALTAKGGFLGSAAWQKYNEKPQQNDNSPYATPLTPEYFKNNY